MCDDRWRDAAVSGRPHGMCQSMSDLCLLLCSHRGGADDVAAATPATAGGHADRCAPVIPPAGLPLQP